MLLQTYLSMNSLTQAELADHLGKRPQTVWRWCKLLVVPPREDMVRIFVWTHGAVTPNDFYDLPDLTQGGLDALQARSHSAAPSSFAPLQDGAAGPGGDGPASPPTPLLSAIGVAA